MEKNIWVISQSNSHILTQIISDNFMMLGLAERIKIFDAIDDQSSLTNALDGILSVKSPVVYYIFENADLSNQAKNYCDAHQIRCIDVHQLTFSFFYKTIAEKLNGLYEIDYVENMDKDFVNFAIASDDGKKLDSLHEADLVIIGISRTTKTPLSMYLSNHGYRVANVPLVPEVSLPRELLEIDPNKVFLLHMDSHRLHQIRKERLKHLGLPDDAIYASLDRILDEQAYAQKVVDQIGCKTVDVSSLSIEETAKVIIYTIQK